MVRLRTSLMLEFITAPRSSFEPEAQVLADPVVHHDRVGQGVTGQGQQGGDEKKVDFFPEDEKETQDRQDVVKGGGRRSHAEGELEPPGEVDDHADGGDHHGDQGVIPEALADFGADLGHAFHDELVFLNSLEKAARSGPTPSFPWLRKVS